MDFGSFYALKEPFRSGALRVRLSDSSFEDGDLDLLLGTVRPDIPIVFDRSSGRKVFDCVYTTFVTLVLVSNRVVDLFARNEFTGWSVYPVEIYGHKGERLLGYHGLSVTGRAGPLDSSLSEPWMFPAPTPQGKPHKGLKGLYFQPETWDGSDIFCPEGTAYKVVTERVKKAIEQNEITNVYFRPLTEIENLERGRRHFEDEL